MFIITARGDSGFEPGERNEKLNYQDPYLRTLLIHWHHRHHLVHVEEFGGTSLANRSRLPVPKSLN